MPVELSHMKTLAELAGEAQGILRDMGRLARVPLSKKPQDYSRRKGYAPAFLQRFPVPRPILTCANRDDEVPLLDGSGTELKYEHFSIAMSKSRRLARYVACNIDGSRSVRIRRGKDTWSLDPRIDTQYQCGEELYADNELDRGHLVRREDAVWGEKKVAAVANEDTFHFTNCAPQHAQFNRKIWLGLEGYILKNSRAHQLRVNVLTGPVFREDDPTYREVQLPREYWKVVTVVTDGRNSATAYMISQSELLERLRAFGFGTYKTYQVSIAHVESLTGLDFGTLRNYDGFSTQERRVAGPMRTEIRSWRDIRI